MLQFFPAVIMFIFTVAFTSLFLIPVTSYTPKDAIAAFYWRGVWIFLSAICAVSGAANTVKMMGYGVQSVSESILLSLLVTFVVFIMFAWVRLAGKAVWHGVKRYFVKEQSPQV